MNAEKKLYFQVPVLLNAQKILILMDKNVLKVIFLFIGMLKIKFVNTVLKIHIMMLKKKDVLSVNKDLNLTDLIINA